MNAAALAVTGSLKMIETFASRATSTAPFAGVVLATLGAASAPLTVKFCGLPAFGPAKSVALLSVSCVPPMRSYELSPLVVGIPEMPVPSRHCVPPMPSPPTPSIDCHGVGKGDAGACAVREAGPVVRVARNRPGVPTGSVVGEQVVLAGRKAHARGDLEPGSRAEPVADAQPWSLQPPMFTKLLPGVDELDVLVVAPDRTAEAELRDDDAARRGDGRNRASDQHE